MKKELTGIDLIIRLIVLTMAVMMIVGLSIPLAVVTMGLYSYHYSFQLNGFNTLLGDDWLGEFSGAVAAVNWILLFAGISSIVLAILTFKKRKIKFELAVVLTAIISAFLYLIEGIVIAVESSNAYVGSYSLTSNATTISPVLFSIQLVLLVSYFICNKYTNRNKDFSTDTQENQLYNQPQFIRNIPNLNTNNFNSTDELIKYKELLEMGAITQEEFDAKKKELLGL